MWVKTEFVALHYSVSPFVLKFNLLLCIIRWVLIWCIWAWHYVKNREHLIVVSGVWWAWSHHGHLWIPPDELASNSFHMKFVIFLTYQKFMRSLRMVRWILWRQGCMGWRWFWKRSIVIWPFVREGRQTRAWLGHLDSFLDYGKSSGLNHSLTSERLMPKEL